MKRVLHLLLLLTIGLATVSGQTDSRAFREQTNGLEFVQAFTGSGMALSSGEYNYWTQFIDNDKKYTQDKKRLERSIYRKRHREKDKSYHFRVVFHNLSRLDKETFTKQSEYQIEALNRDFGGDNRLSTKDTYSSIVDTAGFRFSLSTQGESEYEPIDWRDWNSVKLTKRGEEKPIQTTDLITIWVVDIPNEIGSYAQMPLGPQEYDGIVIDVDYFGVGRAPYDQGKTMTFLMGTYFGLYPLYNGGRCNDDLVADTPVHHEAIRACFDVEVRTSCDNRSLMTSNFMSYAPDACKRMFTKGQVNRMKNMIDGSRDRNSLLAKKTEG